MKLSKKQKKILFGVLTGIIVGLFTSFGTHYLASDFFTGLEKVSYDYRYSFKYILGGRQEAISGDLIEGMTIVDIDERALSKLGRYSKWPRTYHGKVVKELSRGGASAIMFDIMFKTADSGKSQAREIQDILNSSNINLPQEETLKALKNGLNYDSALVSLVRESQGVISAAFMNEKSAYPNKSDWEDLSTKDRHLSLNPNSTTQLPPEKGRHFRTLPILDNIFPSFAQASTRLGLVNVVPDPDGIHRSIPLFYNFPVPDSNFTEEPYTYAVSGLQTSLHVLGKELKDIEIRPGEFVNLGKALTITNKEGKLKVSYPRLTPLMIEQILKKKDKILDLGKSSSSILNISNPIVARTDEDGVIEVEILEGQFLIEELLYALEDSRINDSTLNLLTEDNFLELTDFITLSGTEEQGRYLLADEETEEEVELDKYTINILKDKNIQNEINDIDDNQSLYLSSYLNLTYSRNRKDFISPVLVLTKDVLYDLCTYSWEDILDLKDGESLEFGTDIKIPIDNRGKMLINYQGEGGPNRTFRYISYFDVMAKRMDPTTYQGRVFLLGSSAAALFDIVSSTFDETYPGVEIHSTVIQNILTKSFMHKISAKKTLVILIFIGVLVGFITYFFKIIWAILVAAILGIGYATLCFIAFDNNYWLEMVRPELTIFFTFMLVLMVRYIFEERDKKFLNDAFKNYISPELIDMMVESGSKPSLGGKEGVLTAYFTDIQAFSTFSEKLGSPTKLVELLNEYLSEMTNILLSHQGTLDKYEGDAIIAFFGAPVDLPNHALVSCQAALAMQEKLGDLRVKWKSEGEKWPDIVHNMRMRIGLNTGPIVTGNMGSSIRMNYTMMGDAVNLAARLESGAKQYGVYTICSQETLNGIEEELISRELDLIKVVGKSKPVRIFELLGEKGQTKDSILECINFFAKGLEEYRNQNWESAITEFAKSNKLEPYHPDTNPGCRTTPSQVFLERCHNYQTDRRANLPEDWDGVYTASEK